MYLSKTGEWKTICVQFLTCCKFGDILGLRCLNFWKNECLVLNYCKWHCNKLAFLLELYGEDMWWKAWKPKQAASESLISRHNVKFPKQRLQLSVPTFLSKTIEHGFRHLIISLTQSFIVVSGQQPYSQRVAGLGS